MGKTLSGPGKMGSMKNMKKSLKGGSNEFIRNIPGEGTLTVRFLDEPHEFHGYFEHWVGGKPIPCTTDECEGCNSDDPEEQKKMFRYLGNGYVVDDQRVRAIKMPKTLVQQLVDYYDNNGTLLDRDYDLKKSGSGKNNTRYTAAPDSPSKMKLDRFKKFDLQEVLESMINDDEDPPKAKGKGKSKDKDKPKKKKEKNPWDDVEDERPKRKKSASKSKPAAKRTVKKSTGKRRVVRK